MKMLRYFLFSSIIWMLLVNTSIAQETFTIALVEGRQALDTASVTNIGDDGLSRFIRQTLAFGIDIIFVDLNSPLSEDVDLLTIIRPSRRLSATQTAHLWDYLKHGGNLLLAVDPNGHNEIRSENDRSGIVQLLDQEYGIRLYDDILVPPWFDTQPLSDVVTSWTEAIPNDFAPHPIIQPLVMYDLPIRFWGSRSLWIEAVNGVADTNALIYVEDLYAETSTYDLENTRISQFELNIDEDRQGRLLLGSIGQNLETGSKVAVIGDSEIFQNIYGLTRNPANEDLPLFVGNSIFIERLTQWLLDIPIDNWESPLDEAFTWIALDGQLDDWDESISTYNDTVLEINPLAYDIKTIQLFHSDNFAYLAMTTFDEPNSTGVITLTFQIDGTNRRIVLENDSVSILDNDKLSPIGDADYAISEATEVRLPLRLIGKDPILLQVCMTSRQLEASDCYDEQIVSTSLNSIDPVQVRFQSQPMAFVGSFANLREGPSVDNAIIAGLNNRTQLAILGRNEIGDWIKVANGRYEGWIAEFALIISADINLLPILES